MSDLEKELLAVSNKNKFHRVTLFEHWLINKDIQFCSYSNGIHVQITHEDTVINVWPTTCRMHIVDIQEQYPSVAGWDLILRKIEEICCD